MSSNDEEEGPAAGDKSCLDVLPGFEPAVAGTADPLILYQNPEV